MKTCSTENCSRAAHARSMCKRHYDLWWRTTPKGRASEGRHDNTRGVKYGQHADDPSRRCNFAGCDLERRAAGLCMKHYQRRWAQEHSDQVLPRNRTSRRRGRATLTEWYVRERLRDVGGQKARPRSLIEFPPTLLAAKAAFLKVLRRGRSIQP